MLLLGEFLRLPYLLHPWLKDQAAIHAVIADLVEGRAHSAFPMPYTTTAFHRLLGLLFSIFGEGVLLPRLVAASLAAATTVATYALARRIFGPTAALFAALLTATSPLLLSTPAVGLPNDPLVLLLSLLALLAALRRRSGPLAALSAAILALGLYVRFFYAPAMPLFGLLCLGLAPRGHRLRLAGAFALAGAAVLTPLSWILLGTDDGLAVVEFTREAVSGRSTMHTAAGQAFATPLLQRLSEATVTVHQILLGRMNVGGMMRSAGASWVGLAAGIGGLGLAGLRALRPRPGRALEDRFLFGWMAGAFAILVLVVAWPSEVSDPSLGPYRAPRYFILLFPGPWIAAGGAIEAATARLVGRSRTLALAGLGALAIIPASPMGSVALLAGRGGRVVREARDVTAGLVREIEDETGAPPIVLADVPPGDARNWRRPRFALGYDAFLAEVPDPRERAAWRLDQRLGLALAYSQMLYQVEPDLYELDLAFGATRAPARIHLLDQPFPPLQPVLDRSEGIGPAVPHLVVASSSIGAAVLQQRVPGVHEDRRLDRITRFERFQPGVPRLATVLGATRPAYAFYRLDLQARVWSNLSVRFGFPEEALRAPDRVWAFPETIFQPELGYGFSHAFLEVGTWRNAGEGILPRFPVSFSVRVPEGGVYEGLVTAGRGCQSPAGRVEIGGVVVAAEPDTSCEDDSTVIWSADRYRFCAPAVDGLVTVRFVPQPRWGTPWLIEELQLRRADGTPPALRLGGCDEAQLATPERAAALHLLAGVADPLRDADDDPLPLPPGLDLRAASAAADPNALHVRFTLAGPALASVRFWVQQDGRLLLVTAASGDGDRRCEVEGEGSRDVPGCVFPTASGLDLRLPWGSLAPIDPGRPLVTSGFQTCCDDDGAPWDPLAGAVELRPRR